MSRNFAQAVVIGASAGALDALSSILPELPSNYPLPVMVVVHIPAHKESLLPSLLAAKCEMKVHEAEDKEPLAPGTIYVAPPDYHLLVEKDGSLSLSNDEEIMFSRPSIDALFESAADAFGDGLIGILLTGANDDGATGLKTIVEAGGTALIQEPSEAASPTMPLAAIKACPHAQVMGLTQIRDWLKQNSMVAV
jgi:two-component system chemotaxis response regulator CheB